MLPAPSTRSHTLLRAPITNESERLHFQRRLAFTLLVVFVLSFGFWVATVLVHLVVGLGHIGILFTTRPAITQLTTEAIALTAWVVVRRGTHSIPFLDVADVLATALICWGWDYMATCEPGPGRTEMVGLLAVSYTLVTRAAFVPSTTARTALVAALGFAPIIPATHLMYGRIGAPAFMPLAPAIYATIWSVLGVSATATISYITYGLRLQVRKAMQLGQYMLETKIGEGGMGIVYRASHALLRRPTAIKLLTGSTGHAAERFEREVQLTARLTHPNTIAVYDYGRTPDGVFYYAMEYLEGITLDELVSEHGPQPAPRVVHILLQICGALEEAHGSGLVHRDIKPANVMLTERGGVQDVVKVLDFGLVKETADATSELSTSTMNAVLGTPHFMAPEAILDPPSVDGRADLYSLGVTAYFLLTGERVFDGANLVEICSAHLHQAPVPPSKHVRDVPADLERVILRCLEKKAKDRPASAADLTELLLGCNVPAWSRADARAWWERHPTKSAAPTQPTKRRRETQLEGATVTIALDDRA
jgi:eukaryotic-like serine/threonine-protein kinase